MKKYCLGCLLLLLLAACNSDNNQKQHDPVVVKSDTSQTAASAGPLADSLQIFARAKEALTALKTKDYRSFALMIDPEKGIRFSPYGYIDSTQDMFFTRQSFTDAAIIHSKKKFNWGSYDGSGETIRASIAEYFSKFVYDVDFLNAEKISFNKMSGSGNSLNNLEAVYSGKPFTESYFSGFEEKYDGMDWRVLRIVYNKMGDNYFIIAIVHDQWTI